jgi:hypothetical protein
MRQLIVLTVLLLAVKIWVFFQISPYGTEEKICECCSGSLEAWPSYVTLSIVNENNMAIYSLRVCLKNLNTDGICYKSGRLNCTCLWKQMLGEHAPIINIVTAREFGTRDTFLIKKFVFLTQDSRCPGLDSKEELLKYSATTLRLA